MVGLEKIEVYEFDADSKDLTYFIIDMTTDPSIGIGQFP